jgi:hypothetical protein
MMKLGSGTKLGTKLELIFFSLAPPISHNFQALKRKATVKTLQLQD